MSLELLGSSLGRPPSRRPFPLVASGRALAYFAPTDLKIGMFASLAT